MSGLPVPSPISDADFEAIEAAVVETTRGRWFLAEYARRNRYAETQRLLEVLHRIEHAVSAPTRDPQLERVRMSILEMAQAISRTKDEIAAIKPTQAVDGRFGEATEELDAIVVTTETATGDILHAAEQIQEVAWTLRERGFEGPICDVLDERATDIYTACSFQDLTGQRTRKVIGVLHFLEARINAMIDIWGLDGATAVDSSQPSSSDKPEGHRLASGPARFGEGLGQNAVDAMLVPPNDDDLSSMSIDDIMAAEASDFAAPSEPSSDAAVIIVEATAAPEDADLVIVESDIDAARVHSRDMPLETADAPSITADFESRILDAPEELVALDIAETKTHRLDGADEVSEDPDHSVRVVHTASEPASVRLSTTDIDALSAADKIALFT